MQKIRKPIIVIDLMGVILHEGLYASKILYPMIKGKIPYLEFKKRYTLYCVGNIDAKEFWHGIISEKEIGPYEQRFLDTLVETKGAVQSLQRLTKVFNLILFSEAPSAWGRYLLQSRKWGRLFKKTMFSGDFGATKPFARFYQNLLQYVPNPKASFFLDDTVDNLIVARNLHFMPLHFGSKGQSGSGILSVGSFKELEKYLFTNG